MIGRRTELVGMRNGGELKEETKEKGKGRKKGGKKIQWLRKMQNESSSEEGKRNAGEKTEGVKEGR